MQIFTASIQNGVKLSFLFLFIFLSSCEEAPEIPGKTISYGEGDIISINEDLIIGPKDTLILTDNAQILMAKGTNIIVKGMMVAQGNDNPGIDIKCQENLEHWGKIIFQNAKPSILQRVLMNGGDIEANNTALTISACYFPARKTKSNEEAFIKSTGAPILITECYFNGNNTGGGIIIKDAKDQDITIKECRLIYTYRAIEISNSQNANILNCHIMKGRGTALGLYGCSNILVERNEFHQRDGIALSLENRGINYTDSITIKRNVFWRNMKAISVTEGSTAFADRNTFYLNDSILICAEKTGGMGRSKIVMESCIFAGHFNIRKDKISEIEINYSLSTNLQIEGKENLLGDPLLVNAEKYDFKLKKESPCIDSGMPGNWPDPDGTKRDMGAFPFDHRIE